jgi:hypothetical protein
MDRPLVSEKCWEGTELVFDDDVEMSSVADFNDVEMGSAAD